MPNVTARNARSSLSRLIDEAADNHAPIHILGKRNTAVLIGVDDWNAIQETLHLGAIAGMPESIKRGLKTPVAKLSKKAGW